MKIKPPHQSNWERGLTLIEVMVVFAVILFVAALYLPTLQQRHTGCRINCVNHLKQVGLAFRTFSLDNNYRYPMQTPATNGTLEIAAYAPAYMHFQVMSNELTTPKILLCPQETQRTAATNFGPGLDNGRISYFVGLAANETNAQMFLAGDRNMTNGSATNRRFLDLTTNKVAGWTAELHNQQGNVCFADGSVQQFASWRLRQAIAATGDPTNRLAMPY